MFSSLLSVTAAITVDGDFSDWASVSTLVTDPADAIGNPESDFLSAKASSDATNLYLYYQTSATFDLGAIGFRFNILLDTDQTPTTGFKLYGSSAGGFDYLFQGATLYTFAGTDNTNEWTWDWSPTLGFGNSGNEAEFAQAAIKGIPITPDPEGNIGHKNRLTIKPYRPGIQLLSRPER